MLEFPIFLRCHAPDDVEHAFPCGFLTATGVPILGLHRCGLNMKRVRTEVTNIVCRMQGKIPFGKNCLALPLYMIIWQVPAL